MEQQRPGRGLANITDDLGLSRGAVWRQAKSVLSMSPQRYVMLQRFDKAVNLLQGGLPIAQVAAAAGYADQSHLHREVVRLAHTTPAKLVAMAGATYVQDGDPILGGHSTDETV